MAAIAFLNAQNTVLFTAQGATTPPVLAMAALTGLPVVLININITRKKPTKITGMLWLIPGKV